MDNTELLLLALLGGGFALLIIVGLAKYFADYFADIRYVKMKVDCAYGWKEYVYWRRELSALRWSIIPGLTPDRVKAIKRFFYRGKHAEKKEKSDGFTSLLMPSVLGICICAVCLAGSTFAWFTASESTATQTIQAANYTVSAEISDKDGTPITTASTAALEKGTYAVKLTASGEATTGYVVVAVSETEIYREQLKPTETFSFTLVANEAATLEITYQWGTAATPHSRIQDGTYTYGTASATVENPPAEENGNEDKNPNVTEPAEEITPSTTETQPPEITPQHPEETTEPSETVDIELEPDKTKISITTDDKDEIKE